MKNALIIACILFVAACRAGSGDGLVSDGAPVSEASCTAAGGTMLHAKIGQICSMPASDAGQACTSNSHCEGLCMSDGQCSPLNSNFGCHEVLENGKRATICID